MQLDTSFRHVLIGAASAQMMGCIVVPVSTQVYDPECRILTRQMTLEAAYIGGFQRCAGEGCVALLATAGAITAASVVVSGSIALVGQVVYWFERQGQCKPGSESQLPAGPAGPARLQVLVPAPR